MPAAPFPSTRTNKAAACLQRSFPLRPTFNPERVELASPGTQGGQPFYLVDIVEVDGGRACMWAGTDRVEAMAAAVDCAEGGLVAVDLTGSAARPIVAGTVH